MSAARPIRMESVPDTLLLRQQIRELHAELRTEKAARAQIETALGRMWHAIRKLESRAAKIEQPRERAMPRSACFICGSVARCRHREHGVELAELALAAELRQRSEP